MIHSARLCGCACGTIRHILSALRESKFHSFVYTGKACSTAAGVFVTGVIRVYEVWCSVRWCRIVLDVVQWCRLIYSFTPKSYVSYLVPHGFRKCCVTLWDSRLR
jgi:hypothetical protein